MIIASIASQEVFAQDVSPSQYWKDEIVFPNDPFESHGQVYGDMGWIKFTLLKEPYNPDIVYFQDSTQYALHYEFATNELDPYIGIGAEDFFNISLYEQAQELILGAIVTPPSQGYPPQPDKPEYGIQFVRQDPYTPEQIVEMFHKVKDNIQADANVQAFYFPTYEQSQVARDNIQYFAQNGVPVSSTLRWITGNVCYSQGWAFGELKYFPTDQIASAYRNGLLEPGDILMTDAVPAEIPIVAGVISLTPSTPNSHVVILANTHAIPFVFLADPDDIARANELLNNKIVLRAYADYMETFIKLIDTEDVLTETQAQELLDLKQPAELGIATVDTFGAYSASTEDMTPTDIKYFGGKAANYSILRNAIGDNCPPAAAFSFDLWNAFLDQTLSNGATFREHIDSLLAPNTYPPVNMAVVSGNLDIIRNMFRGTAVTSFSPELQLAVIDMLTDQQYGFDPLKKIRFRSSTNVEDSEFFVGAGLYDSYSGCLADDLDTDQQGPCLCDPDRDNERGVFHAIRRVFASFYYDNAYLERLRHGINEHDVGMGILVHHSFPDEIELANGVATLTKTTWSTNLVLVTQDGAVSVANPEPGVIPEEVTASVSQSGVHPYIQRYSNLVPLGMTVLDWKDDYIQLTQLLVTAANEFARITGTDQYTLDFEYKKIAGGKLIVKQIRQLPSSDTTDSITPMLIHEPSEFVIMQGEHGGDVFAQHRCKSMWKFEIQTLWLSEKNLANCFYTDMSLDYADNGRLRNITGQVPLLPRAVHSAGPSQFNDGLDTGDLWSMHHLSNTRTCMIETTGIPVSVSRSENPVYTLNDFGPYNFDIGMIMMSVDYTRPVRTWDWRNWSVTGTAKNDQVYLWPMPKPSEKDLPQHRRIADAKLGATIDTNFYWPPPPAGIIAGYTAPLARWDQTVITGLTTEPIVLHGFFSQTYKPGHHNFFEMFMFEPQLEKNISRDILDQLKAKDIRLIHAVTESMSGSERRIVTYGFDEVDFLDADINLSGKVDIADLLALALRWMDSVCHECDRADLTGDGNVNLKDLAEISRQYMLQIK